MAHLDTLLKHLKDRNGSDLHLSAGLVPTIRVNGELTPVRGWEPMSHEDLLQHLSELCSQVQWNHYEGTHDLDFAYSLEGQGRFRANFFMQERGCGAVFRHIPEKVRTLEELNAPKAIATLADIDQGLVLVTGPTGSGKSTTLAAVIDLINTRYVKHIVTIEDPVEVLHTNRRSTFSQREVGTDTMSFAVALRAAIRQDPGVILVGELRDLETISLALTAAEMGVLVFGTLHTSGATRAVDRIIGVFPADQQPRVRTVLSEALAAVVSQELLPLTNSSGRVAVHEILLRTPGLANVIREANTPMINSIIQGGKPQGMQQMDDALFALASSGKVDGEEAYRKAANKARFEDFLR